MKLDQEMHIRSWIVITISDRKKEGHCKQGSSLSRIVSDSFWDIESHDLFFSFAPSAAISVETTGPCGHARNNGHWQKKKFVLSNAICFQSSVFSRTTIALLAELFPGCKYHLLLKQTCPLRHK